MGSERTYILSRHLTTLHQNAVITSSVPSFEWTLDGSLVLVESLLFDLIFLIALDSEFTGQIGEPYPKVIERHILQELSFVATKNIIMAIVKRGGDWQAAHEKIKVRPVLWKYGLESGLIERIKGDE